MAVGIPVTKEDLDRQAGQIAGALDKAFEQIERLQAYLAATPGEDLEAPPFGYTAQEVAVLKSAYGDLDTLRKVYLGQAAAPQAIDYRRFAGQLTGLGLI